MKMLQPYRKRITSARNHKLVRSAQLNESLGHRLKPVFVCFHQKNKPQALILMTALRGLGLAVNEFPMTHVYSIRQLEGVGTVGVMIWNSSGSKDYLMYDYTYYVARTGQLISITFDGTRPDFGLGDNEFYDFSENEAWVTSPAMHKIVSVLKTAVENFDVFVSYAREDESIAAAIIRGLADCNLSTWWDKSIPAGSEYSPLIEKILRSARAVVVLWSKASIESHWVRDEAAIGRDRGVLIPVSIDGVAPPIGFGQLNSLHVKPGRDVGNLASEISWAFAKINPRPAPRRDLG